MEVSLNQTYSSKFFTTPGLSFICVVEETDQEQQKETITREKPATHCSHILSLVMGRHDFFGTKYLKKHSRKPDFSLRWPYIIVVVGAESLL